MQVLNLLEFTTNSNNENIENSFVNIQIPKSTKMSFEEDRLKKLKVIEFIPVRKA